MGRKTQRKMRQNSDARNSVALKVVSSNKIAHLPESSFAELSKESARRAVELYKERRYPEAISAAREAVRIAPDDPEMWVKLGVCLRADRQFEEAIACYLRALRFLPDNSGIWSNLGNAHKDLKHYETALLCHRRAIALQPSSASAYHNLAVALTGAGRHEEALSALERALLLNPTDFRIRWDMGLTRLYMGQLSGGWLDYAARLRSGDIRRRDLPGKPWVGQRYDGQRLLIVCEQGIGDALWAARYFRKVRDLGGELIVECRKELIPFFEQQGFAHACPEKQDPMPEADWHCYLCSLPGLFTPDAASINGQPYLRVPTDRLAKFKEVFARAGSRLRVGIVWSGSVTFVANHDRALPLSRLLPAIDLPGVQLYSLQKGEPSQQLQAAEAHSVIDLDPLLDDFGDTAAAVSGLDLVIMSDSSVAHLCGALGRPLWLLLGHAPYWLWGKEGETTPWYDSVRMFRSPVSAADNWLSVLDHLTAALTDLVVRRAHVNTSRELFTGSGGAGSLPVQAEASGLRRAMDLMSV